jgi:hypothetical protein
MAHLADKMGGEVYDETEAYDKQHGTTTCEEESKPVNLSEAGNSPPPHQVPFKITVK